VFRSVTPITLSDVLPQLQHMGLEVLDEHPYEFGEPSRPFWIYDFGLRAETRGGRPRRGRRRAAGSSGAVRAVARPDRG
jgi:glutamate dehydrogenase